mgnify:CR=1 FL=1|tara:strand:- start:20401 stop:21693 length:1293 start_codon:yes stop_codon:yes gene_type:complete
MNTVAIRTNPIAVLFISILISLIFGVLRYHNGFEWIINVSLIFSFFSFLYFLQYFLRNGLRISYIELYFYLTILVILPLSAIMASINYDQPLFLGFATQRDLLFVFMSSLLLILLKQRLISLEDIKRAFIIVSWLNLIFCLIAMNFIDLNNATSGSTWVLYKGDGLNRYNLPNQFILFGFIYYIVEFLRKKSFTHLLFSFAFFTYLFSGNISRITVLSLLITFFIFSFNSNTNLILRKKIFETVAIFSLLGLLFILINLEIFASFAMSFIEAGLVIFGLSDLIVDLSALSRIDQFENIASSFFNNIILGNGSVSQQFDGGLQTIFGYFYPSDLGIIGIIWEHGLIIFFLLSFQYFIAYKQFQKFKIILKSPDNDSGFIITIGSILIIYLISNLTIGSTAFLLDRMTLLFFILHFALIKKGGYSYFHKVKQ